VRGSLGRRTRRTAALLLGLLLIGGCARFRPWRTPEDVSIWQPTDPPTLALEAKARTYQERMIALHVMPDGVVRYKLWASEPRERYGNWADGSFFTGLYLASQALRLAVTGDAAARLEVARTLDGMQLLMDVTGEPGLIARYVGRQPYAGGKSEWVQSTTRPGYWWRADVSKDQLAGYVCGLGVALAELRDPAARARIAAIAGPLAQHLDRNDYRVRDHDGEVTTYGDVRPRVLGFPVGIHALIALAIARTAERSGADAKLWERLLAEGALDVAGTAHWRFVGYGKRVNDNMAHAALLPLLLLEDDPERLATLREVARRLWSKNAGEHNAFFAFVQATANADAGAAAEGRAALGEFPERKRDLPVDLTRPGFDIERSWWQSSKGIPRARDPLPLYLRPAGSNLWVSDPRHMAGSIRDHGDMEYAGIDYLLAYWLGRAGGFVEPED